MFETDAVDPQGQEQESHTTGESGSELPVEESKGLGLRDALQVALEAEKPEKEAEVQAKVEQPTEQKLPILNAPAEWSKEEKEDFNQLSRRQQEAALRIHNSRKSVLEQISREKEEVRRESADLQWAKDIAKEITPFLKARGGKEPAHSQIIKALEVVNEIDSNTKDAVVKILRAKGIPIPGQLISGEDGDESTAEKKSQNDEIVSLRNELNEIKNKYTQEEVNKKTQTLAEAYNSFTSKKNAAGNSRFPDLNNTEEGIRLASSIGSLVGGETPLSKSFIANVRSRIPDADYQTLMQEAYRFYGGRVDDSEPKYQSPNKIQLIKSSRAAASVPGRGSQYVNGQAKGKAKSIREALEMSMAQLNDE